MSESSDIAVFGSHPVLAFHELVGDASKLFTGAHWISHFSLVEKSNLEIGECFSVGRL